MPRMARAVVSGVPHHVTQRGNRRQPTFFQDSDYQHYLDLLSEWTRRCGVEVWAYCLMPNHVHLVAVPSAPDGLRFALGEAHRRYTRMVNFREGWRGHLWQGRFASFVMDDAYLMACVRYVELNPVRAGLVERPGDWPWSSARAHLSGQDDVLVRAEALLGRVHYAWSEFIALPVLGMDVSAMRMSERTGRPLGEKEFIHELEQKLGRRLAPQKGGRPKKEPKP